MDPFIAFVGGVVIAVFAFGFGHCLGWCSGRESHQREAIKRGFAQFNPETGDWEWRKVTTNREGD